MSYRSYLTLAEFSDIWQNGCIPLGWLALFRDFWGMGAEATRKRPDVSAPDLRHAFGRRRESKRAPWKTAEWLQKPKGGVILGDTPAFDSHIVHAR